MKNNSFLRFVLVGIVNTGIGLTLMFFFLNFLQLSYWVSTFIGNFIGAVISFLLNRRFTFNSSITTKKGLPLFLVVVFLCYIVSYSLSQELVDLYWLNFAERLSTLQLNLGDFMALFYNKKNIALLIGSVIYTITNYFGQKQVVFLQKKPV